MIVVGGGPAGSVAAWDLARRGADVLLLDRARFPRDKVCGDYVEPRGLRLLDAMGCLERIESTRPLPITHSCTFVDSRCLYRGPIPFYGRDADLPPHGYIVPRRELDRTLLDAAVRAGARVEEESAVERVDLRANEAAVAGTHRGDAFERRAEIVIGADGVNSVVARSAGLLVDDARTTAVAQRAYADGFEGELGEAAFLFDEDLFPGYGWAFPMAGGVVNLGVGILAETRERLGVNVPDLFRRFVEKLTRCHPRAARVRVRGAPIGGIVKTYGGAGPNHAARALLVGDAGSFVDPITGEGIAPAME